jgi:hypothetical protein
MIDRWHIYIPYLSSAQPWQISKRPPFLLLRVSASEFTECPAFNTFKITNLLTTSSGGLNSTVCWLNEGHPIYIFFSRDLVSRHHHGQTALSSCTIQVYCSFFAVFWTPFHSWIHPRLELVLIWCAISY